MTSCGPCIVSPGARPLIVLATLLFLPTLLQLFFYMAPILLIVCMTTWLLNDSNDGVKSACRMQRKTNDVGKTKDETEHRAVHHVSGALVQLNEDMITVVLTMPGLRTEDLNARVIDEHHSTTILRVTGQTKKGTDLYSVAKEVPLPAVDIETMTARHEDGVLTVAAKRKIRHVSIPISSPVKIKTTPTDNTTEKSEDEWEALPVKNSSAKTSEATE